MRAERTIIEKFKKELSETELWGNAKVKIVKLGLE